MDLWSREREMPASLRLLIWVFCLSYFFKAKEWQILPETSTQSVNFDWFQRSQEVFWLCWGPWIGQMVCCDRCNEWFHTKCMNMELRQFERIKTRTWLCKGCHPTPPDLISAEGGRRADVKLAKERPFSERSTETGSSWYMDHKVSCKMFHTPSFALADEFL